MEGGKERRREDEISEVKGNKFNKRSIKLSFTYLATEIYSLN